MKWSTLILSLSLLQSVKSQSVLAVADSGNTAKLIQYSPSSFSNKFSINIPPVLHVRSGDTISTETIDAMGFDKSGVKRQRGGNPLTGPFYIEDCHPGDILQITLVKVILNRPYAYTTEAFVSRSMPEEITKPFKKFHLVKWKLDMVREIGWPDSSYLPYEHLQNFSVPLKPFLGCIGVAPMNKKNEILSFFQGSFGGNMDFSRIGQCAIVYLPVFHEGAYFYIGDGHAAQGDGEIAGNALETSLHVDFIVHVISKGLFPFQFPRIEDSVYMMSIGSSKKLESALQLATAGLLEWLQKDYRLSTCEATQVMSTTIEYTIAEIADPEVIVVAKIKKERLKSLQHYR